MVNYLLRRHGVHEVLLVGEDEHGHGGELLLLEELSELDARLLDAAAVRRVDHIHQRVGLVKVVPPVRADRLLAANVPHVQFELVLHQRLDIEALGGRDRLDVLLVRVGDVGE